MTQDFEQAVDRIYLSLQLASPYVDWSLGDARVRHPEYTRLLLDAVGAPDRGRRRALVAGSKGKGSTCIALASLLEAHGLRVGLFTSPHSVSFEERIRVNGRAIDAGTFVALEAELAPARAALQASLPRGHYLSPVGQALILACLHFARQATDLDVIECGRGGAYDDTNMVDHELALITPVFEEHTDRLGPDLASIGRHKAGICRRGTRRAVVARQRLPVRREIERQAAEEGVPVWWEGRDFEGGWARDGRLAVRLPSGLELTAHAPVQAGYQAQNFTLAAAAASCAVPLNELRVGTALGRLALPGRCQVLQDEPLVVVDGAIHRSSAQHVADLLRRTGRRPVVCVASVPLGKDYPGVLAALAPVADELWVTEAKNPHLCFPADAEAVARGVHPRARRVDDLAAAVRLAEGQLGQRGALAIVGTQSLVGEALAIWGRDIRNLW